MSTYNSARNKRTDTRSSAWTFLIIGGAGFLLITLALIGVIALPLSVFSLAVMEIVFILFLIIALVSFRQAMKLLDEISKEDSLETRIQAWTAKNLSSSELLADTDDNTAEEARYLIAFERIKKQLLQAFPELDESHADQLAEDYCNKLFLIQ